MATVFKVLRKDNGSLYSTVRLPSLVLQYPPGEWVSGPQGLPVLAFDTLQAAKVFLKQQVKIEVFFQDGREYELWEAQPQGDIVNVNVLSNAMDLPHLKMLWDDGIYKLPRKDSALPSTEFFIAPKGTVACESICLVKQVEV